MVCHKYIQSFVNFTLINLEKTFLKVHIPQYLAKTGKRKERQKKADRKGWKGF